MKNPLSKTRKRVKRVSLILLATVLSYVIFSVAGSVIVFRVIFARTATINAFELTYDDIDSAAYPREEIRFPSGGNSLFGCVYRPKGESAGLVMVLNGMNSCIDRHLPEILYFVDSGFSVMSFENTGVDRSEGENTVGLAQARLDTAAAIEYVKADKALSKLPLFLYGHSLGGYAAAAALADSPEVKAAVCLAGFDSPNENMHYSAKKYVGILADLQYPFMCLQNYFLFGDKSDLSAVSAINQSEKPVMIIGGNSDETVPPEISILNKADKITNPNAISFEITEKYRGEHSTLWLSQSAAKYLCETENPDDKQRANELDKEFMEKIIDFFNSECGIRNA